ncbi:MAG: hypothetical protein BroJett018_20400 [Chloroflexota bacterium]|nr:MAG: hypothetical protein BroJett018_20400 [Chloroflexota bacterium]
MTVFADLGAEKPIGAEKGDQKIAVEIKSFLSPSGIYDLERALGQYALYRSILKENDPDRLLYLAIPDYAYQTVFSQPIGELILHSEQLRLIVFDDEQEMITKWIL